LTRTHADFEARADQLGRVLNGAFLMQVVREDYTAEGHHFACPDAEHSRVWVA
jgi:hypothetical protein